MQSARLSLDEIARFFRHLHWLALAIAAVWLLGKLAGVLTPFLVAALLGWMFDPLVDRLEARGMRRGRAFGLVYTLMMLVPLIVAIALLPSLIDQAGTLARDLPRYSDWLMGTAVPWLEQRFRLDLARWFDLDTVTQWVRAHWPQASVVMQNVVGIATKSGLWMVSLVVNLLLIPILAFFFLRDWDAFVARMQLLVPRDRIEVVARLADESADMLRAFLRGQFAVMLLMAIFNAIGLSLVGLDLGILIGVVSGLLSFVPYMGPAFIIVFGSIAALVQFGDWQHVAGVATVWILGQLLESYVITPKLVGDRIGLHPMAVIFAVMAGGVLFGFMGMLLALPVAAVVNVLMRYLLERYTHSALYRGEDDADAPRIIADLRDVPPAPEGPGVAPPG